MTEQKAKSQTCIPSEGSGHNPSFPHGVLAPNAALWTQIVSSQPNQVSPPAEGEATSASTRARLSWAQLLKRVFAIDMASCLHCGGPVTLIAAIEDPAVMAKILAHLGFPTKAPVRSKM